MRARRQLTIDTTDHQLDDIVFPPPDRREFDLSELEFIDPYGLVCLLCSAKSWRDMGSEVSVIAPATYAVNSYAARMRLDQLLEDDGCETAGFTSVREHDRTDRLVECRRFDLLQYDDLVDLLAVRLVDSGLPQNAVDQLLVALYEVGDNIQQHAETAGGYLAAQSFQVGTRSERVVFAVGDVGIGVRESLREGGRETGDDVSALRLAIQPGVTSRPDQHRGYGFEHMREAVLGLTGRLVVRSGSGRLDLRVERTSEREVSHMDGTIVAANVPTATWRR